MTNSWNNEHPGWGSLTAHLESKWKNRFVLSGCECPAKIVEYFMQTSRMKYEYIQFNEAELFPNQDISYAYPCVYFFPVYERDIRHQLTTNELVELYWY